MSIVIYLFPAVTLFQENGHVSPSDVQFLHSMAEKGTISSKFAVNKIQNVKILLFTSWYVLKCGMVTFFVDAPWG